MTKLLTCIALLTSIFTNASEYEFLPVSHPELDISFPGKTQDGTGYHKMAILQLGFAAFSDFEKSPTNDYYVIYDSNDRFGPQILKRLQGHSPYITKDSEDTVSVEYTRGNNGHTKQSWKLIGNTAELLKEEPITWKERRHTTTYDDE